jgi:anti-sigma factor RsiW
MNERDNALRVQAHVDGQLTGSEAAETARWISRDESQRALHDALRSIKTVLRTNELQRAVPETREFYWSQIERRITVASAGRASHAGWLGWWLRWVVPIGATALLCGYWLWPAEERSGTGVGLLLVGHEIETPLAETTSFAFRSESAAMTVVWVETRGLHNLASGE